MSISWYIQRIKTFSPEEVVYRVVQRFRTHVLDKRVFKKTLFTTSVELPNAELIADSSSHQAYPIFENTIDIYKPIDWHLDVQSGKRFPQTFSHKISIRSDEFGSAKHVWEVNRQLFLTHIAMLFKKTGNRKYLDLFMYHLTCWKNENPYLKGVNWYSNIEVNIRLINWFYCWQIMDVDCLQKSDDAVRSFVMSVWMPLIFDHAEFSHKHPSLYSSANNHLVSEYAGLFIAACKWDIPCREKRLKYAQCGLEREILLQNSSDGVNREEAAEYIQFIDDFFLLSAVVGDSFGHPFSDSYKNRLRQMARYLNVMLDVNYNYPMYGDGDDGFLLRPDAGGHFNNFKSLLTAFATYFKDASLKRNGAEWDEKNQLIFGEQGRSLFESLEFQGDAEDKNTFLAESGHYLFRKISKNESAIAEEIYLHMDAAPLGFLSIAAHGHADALSFILHVDGFPVIVDPGTFTYHTHKTWRKYFVGTLAHNTVRVNETNQTVQAGPTMWLNHYKCQLLGQDENSVTATHNGYKKLGVEHSRRMCFNRKENEFVIEDCLKGPSFTAEVPFHIHPNVNVQEVSKGVFEMSVPGARKVVVSTDPALDYRVAAGEENPILGWYSEHFGEKIPCKVLYASKACNGSAKFETKVRIAE